MFPVGALTSKPYAFVSRPWEINSSEGIDFFDSFLSTVRIDERALNIIRILPVSNSSNNEIWISDRIRFCYSFQSNQALISNFIFYDKFFFSVSEEQISMLFFLSFSKTSSIFYDFGIPTPLEFQNICSNFSTFFNKSFYVLNSSSSEYSNDSRSNFILPDLKTFFDSPISNSFFIINFNTRFSFPIFNSSFRISSSKSNFPVFYFGSSFCSNFSSYYNFGNNFYDFTNFLNFKNKLNKLFFNKTFAFNIITASNTVFSSKIINSTTIINPRLTFSKFDSSSSSLLSSELNFTNSNFANSTSFKLENFGFLSFNSSTEPSFNTFYQPSFFASFESNFTFHESAFDFVPDFLLRFQNIFTFTSTFVSVTGNSKSSNNFKKLPYISSYLRNFFGTFFPFAAKDELTFYNFFFKHFKHFYFNGQVFPAFSFNNFDSSISFFKQKIFSDSAFNTESARSHYLRSPYSRYSTSLVLQYSRFKNTLFNHL